MSSHAFKSTSRRIFLELFLVALVTVAADLPDGRSYSDGWHYVLTDPALLLHVLAATVVLVEAAILVARSLRARSGLWSTFALAGLLAVVVAFIFGDRLIAKGQHALDGMTYAWLIAWILYAAGWYVGRRQQRAAMPVGP
jgi:hypothetical protein